MGARDGLHCQINLTATRVALRWNKSKWRECPLAAVSAAGCTVLSVVLATIASQMWQSMLQRKRTRSRRLVLDCLIKSTSGRAFATHVCQNVQYVMLRTVAPLGFWTSSAAKILQAMGWSSFVSTLRTKNCESQLPCCLSICAFNF